MVRLGLPEFESCFWKNDKNSKRDDVGREDENDTCRKRSGDVSEQRVGANEFL